MANVKQDLVNLGLPSEVSNYLGNILGNSDSDELIFTAATYSIHANTADAADTSSIEINGGGATGVTRGGSILLRGNENSGGGGNVEITNGNKAGAILLLRAINSDGTIQFSVGSAERWRINASGVLTQDASNGGGIVMTRASTSLAQSVATAITAAGTTIADGTALTAVYNVITTAAASTGVNLWAANVGSSILVRNAGANTINVWPTSGSDTIDGGAGGAAATIATGKARIFVRVSATAWYSMLGA